MKMDLILYNSNPDTVQIKLGTHTMTFIIIKLYFNHGHGSGKFILLYIYGKFCFHSVLVSVSSSSWTEVSELVQPVPLQLPQTEEHFTLYFLQVHLMMLQSMWQLHLIIFNSSSGVGDKSVSTCRHQFFTIIIVIPPSCSWLHFTGITFHSCIWTYTQKL